jgi:hypothetical protein
MTGRCRYVVHCGGRLLQIFDQHSIAGPEQQIAAGPPYEDGQYQWMIDGSYVADDVAWAMLARYHQPKQFSITYQHTTGQRASWGPLTAGPAEKFSTLFRHPASVSIAELLSPDPAAIPGEWRPQS